MTTPAISTVSTQQVTTGANASDGLSSFAAAVYLTRHGILDQKVRDLVQAIETSNGHLATINTVLAKTNTAIAGGSTTPTLTLTQEETNFLTSILQTTVTVSGTLTQANLQTLRTELTAARDNLTGSNQLQVVQLQQAHTQYVQNSDAMSNIQNKIHSLLKDILSKL